MMKITNLGQQSMEKGPLQFTSAMVAHCIDTIKKTIEFSNCCDSVAHGIK